MLHRVPGLTPFSLEGSFVRLEPLEIGHVEALAAAAAEDRSSYQFTWVPDGIDDTIRYVRAALAQQHAGGTLVWVVRRRRDGRIVGSTRFLDLQVFTWPPPWPPGVAAAPTPRDGVAPTVAEVGSTWYAASAQRSGVNADCKLLLLGHAFERWGVMRVTLKTDARNDASRGAIQRLGAAFEGIRRVHSPATDGTVRDTAYYSILSDEWPAVRDGLRVRLGGP